MNLFPYLQDWEKTSAQQVTRGDEERIARSWSVVGTQDT
jgi:hypothetical protein